MRVHSVSQRHVLPAYQQEGRVAACQPWRVSTRQQLRSPTNIGLRQRPVVVGAGLGCIRVRADATGMAATMFHSSSTGMDDTVLEADRAAHAVRVLAPCSRVKAWASSCKIPVAHELRLCRVEQARGLSWKMQADDIACSGERLDTKSNRHQLEQKRRLHMLWSCLIYKCSRRTA